MTLQAQLAKSVAVRGAAITAAAGAVVVAQLNRDEPRPKTGRLHKSRQVRYQPGPLVSAVTIEYVAPQANWTDEGTRAHVIRPRRARALRFIVGGRVVFARIVHHPGNRGTRWFRRNTTLTAWRSALRTATR